MKPKDVPAGPLVIDTDVFSWVVWLRGDRRVEFEDLIRNHVWALSFATIGELRAGAVSAGWGQPRRAQLETRIRSCVVIEANDDVTGEFAEIYAKVRGQLKGESGVNDMWTAACAIVAGVPVVTGNKSDFLTIANHRALQVIHPDITVK